MAADLVEAVAVALSGRGRSGGSLDVAAEIRALTARTGSLRATGRLLGISHSTLSRWLSGQTTPNRSHRRVLESLRRHNAGPNVNGKRIARETPAEFLIIGRIKKSNDIRVRKVDVVDTLDLQELHEAWLSGDDYAAADVVEIALEQYVEGMSVMTDGPVVVRIVW